MSLILWFSECSYANKHLVGGKCSSLGELYHLSQKINFKIADGFAITTNFYDEFIHQNNLDSIVNRNLNNLNLEELNEQSEIIKNNILSSEFTKEQETLIFRNFNLLEGKYNNLKVAVRSSAIAEDLPNASFAGQQDTYLNITKDSLLISIKKCFASLFNSRAISYRSRYNISLDDVKISVAIQQMVNSQSAGVAFSLDPESGYNKAIVINSSFGIGELVVGGGVKPDEFILDKRIIYEKDPILEKKLGYKDNKIIIEDFGGCVEIKTNEDEINNFSLSDNKIIELGRYVFELEKSYSSMLNKEIGIDVEWALDENDNIFIIQTRPETIHSNKELVITRYFLKEKSNIILTGVAVGDKISSGNIKILDSMKEFDLFEKGDILVTDMTTPDWEPIMKIASGIITNKGGRTCHAAIVARELNLNAIVGTKNATDILKNYKSVTISCTEGETGLIYDKILEYGHEKINIDNNFKIPVNLMLNVGNPESSFNNSLIPNSGVGLARLEFIINNYIKIHPLLLCDYPNIEPNLKNDISNLINNQDPKDFFIYNLSKGIAKIASAFYPNDVIVRLSDFKSNEYKNLKGGYLYEPNEENPMLGWRGASRYYSDKYKNAFELECKALKYAREKMKMTNIIIMVPFCRTPEELKLVIKQMEEFGLKRGENNLKLYIMCEIPSNVIEADEFSPYIDGVSIGGNDLLQLTLGVDRDSEMITYLSDDKNLSYRRMIKMAIETYKKNGVKIGFCGQQPSDSSEFCEFLINCGIDSISVTPDSAIKTISKLQKI
jgi:pyruvate,water dikinase